MRCSHYIQLHLLVTASSSSLTDGSWCVHLLFCHQHHWPWCLPYAERAAGWQTGIPRLPPHYSYREPKTLWAALGWVGTWILALRTLEIPILKGSEENTKSHLCHWMNGETKAKRENKRYLRSHNKSRDEWALTHSFFFILLFISQIFI